MVESLALLIPAALLSAVVGAVVKSLWDRARPSATVTACRSAHEQELLGVKVTVPPDLAARLRSYPWTPELYGDVSAAKVLRVARALETAIEQARAPRAFLETALPELSRIAAGTPDQKRAFLDQISKGELRIIDASITGIYCSPERVDTFERAC